MAVELLRALFGPHRGPRDFTGARVYRGSYVEGTNENEGDVEHDFRVLKGEASIVPGRPVLVRGDGGGLSELETFFVYPVSPIVRLEVHGRRGPGRVYLFREDDPTKERMYVMRLGGRYLGYADGDGGSRSAAHRSQSSRGSPSSVRQTESAE